MTTQPEPTARDRAIDVIEAAMPADTVHTREYGTVGIAPEVGDIVDALLARPEVLRALAEAPEAQPVLIDRDGEEWHWIAGAYHSTSSPCTRSEIEQVWGPITEKGATREA